MSLKQELSDTEFAEMVRYLHCYVDTSMDQWELWSFDSTRGKTYIKIALHSDGPDESYDDLNGLLE